jgi:hypothetical protein
MDGESRISWRKCEQTPLEHNQQDAALGGGNSSGNEERGGSQMDALEKLSAFEEIRQLLSRRTHLIDGKHWDQLADLYTDDVAAHHTQRPRAVAPWSITCAQSLRVCGQFMRVCGQFIQVHLPEIELLSPLAARGVVPMEDLLLWAEDGVQHWVHGYGHYHQEYVKMERGRLNSDHRLTRQYLQ